MEKRATSQIETTGRMTTLPQRGPSWRFWRWPWLPEGLLRGLKRDQI